MRYLIIILVIFTSACLSPGINNSHYSEIKHKSSKHEFETVKIDSSNVYKLKVNLCSNEQIVDLFTRQSATLSNHEIDSIKRSVAKYLYLSISIDILDEAIITELISDKSQYDRVCNNFLYQSENNLKIMTESGDSIKPLSVIVPRLYKDIIETQLLAAFDNKKISKSDFFNFFVNYPYFKINNVMLRFNKMSKES